MTIGSHERAREGKSQIWLTLPEILNALGHFDLDPCSAPPPAPWRTADTHFDGFIHDGLREPWFGRVWLNPPYGNRVSTPWLRKMAQHGSGVALIFARIETAEWQDLIWPIAHSVFCSRPYSLQAP